MTYMFKGAISFNQPIDSWDKRRITDSSNKMFLDATSFRRPLARIIF